MIEDGWKTRGKLLEVPLKERLRDPVDEAALSRMWRVIESRCARHRSRPARFLIILPALALAASVGTTAHMRHDSALLKPGAPRRSPQLSIFAPRAPGGAWNDGNARNAVWCVRRAPFTRPAIQRSG